MSVRDVLGSNHPASLSDQDGLTISDSAESSSDSYSEELKHVVGMG